MIKSELQKEFEKLTSTEAVASNISNQPVVRATALLGTAVINLENAVERLDRTSARLSYVNIGLGVAILIAPVIQICLMLHTK